MTPRDLTMEEREELNRMMKSGFSPSQKRQAKEQNRYRWLVCKKIGEMASDSSQYSRPYIQDFCESVLLHGRLNGYSDKRIDAAIEQALDSSTLESLKEKVSVVPLSVMPDKYSIFKKTRARQFVDAKRKAEMLMSINAEYKEASNDDVLGRLRAEFQKENPSKEVVRVLCEKLKNSNVKGYLNIKSSLPEDKKGRQKAIARNMVVIDLIEDRFYERDTEGQLVELEKRYASLGENGQKGPEGDYLRTQIEITRVKYRAEQNEAKMEGDKKRSESIRRQMKEKELDEKRKTEEWEAGAHERAEKAKKEEIDLNRRLDEFETRKILKSTDYEHNRSYRKTEYDKDLM